MYSCFWCLCYRQLPDIDMLAQALCLSRPVLLKDPCQLASQLLGRLLHITAQDKPVAPGTLNRCMKHVTVAFSALTLLYYTGIPLQATLSASLTCMTC